MLRLSVIEFYPLGKFKSVPRSLSQRTYIPGVGAHQRSDCCVRLRYWAVRDRIAPVGKVPRPILQNDWSFGMDGDDFDSGGRHYGYRRPASLSQNASANRGWKI